jgi:hypothetical protein
MKFVTPEKVVVFAKSGWKSSPALLLVLGHLSQRYLNKV